MTQKRSASSQGSFVDSLVDRLNGPYDPENSVFPLMASLDIVSDRQLSKQLLTPAILDRLLCTVSEALERDAPGIAAEALSVISSWLASDDAQVVKRIYACLVMPRLLSLTSRLTANRPAQIPVIQSLFISIAILIEHLHQAHKQAIGCESLWQLLTDALDVEPETSLQCLAALLEAESEDDDDDDLSHLDAIPPVIRVRLEWMMEERVKQIVQRELELSVPIALALAVCWTLHKSTDLILNAVAIYLSAANVESHLEALLPLSELAANLANPNLLSAVCQCFDNLGALRGIFASLDPQDPRHDHLELVDRIRERLIHALNNTIFSEGADQMHPLLWSWCWERTLIPVLNSLIMANQELPMSREQHELLTKIPNVPALLIGIPAVRNQELRTNAEAFLKQRLLDATEVEQLGEALELLTMITPISDSERVKQVVESTALSMTTEQRSEIEALLRLL